MTSSRPKPTLLCILDGWGCAEPSGNHQNNAIAIARTPNMDFLAANFANSVLDASELHVGLPCGQMGNSEVGHMNIGAGRIVTQDLPRIDASIESGEFQEIPQLKNLIAQFTGQSRDNSVHVMGLVSPGGVHSHQAHIAALANVIAGHGIKVNIHAFLDGRDTPPSSALDYVAELEEALTHPELCRIVTVSGRYFAMDRDKRWERVEKAYDVITQGGSLAGSGSAISAQSAIQKSYAAGVTDEFVEPISIGDYSGIKDGDWVVFANFRADRARQIFESLLDDDFQGFARKKVIRFDGALSMTEYSESLSKLAPALFKAQDVSETLGEVVSGCGLTQLRIAETEKYPHVTYFFSGGQEASFPGEERVLVPSPKVATYDMQPEMSAYEVTDKLVEAVESGRYDLIIANYANTDMVGHTGFVEAAVKAVEAVDECVGRVWAAVEAAGGVMVITADHGNAEMMVDDATAQPHTAHTLNKVPFIVAGNAYTKKSGVVAKDGVLADIAPTILSIMNLDIPSKMTGHNLLD
jgi:2,3-bisphosphoglycerate-independent phosphoglycerate mutase